MPWKDTLSLHKSTFDRASLIDIGLKPDGKKEMDPIESAQHQHNTTERRKTLSAAIYETP